VGTDLLGDVVQRGVKLLNDVSQRSRRRCRSVHFSHRPQMNTLAASLKFGECAPEGFEGLKN
jgi:hypothetical protein